MKVMIAFDTETNLISWKKMVLTNTFYSEILSFIWVRHSFNTETNKNGVEAYVVIIKLS